MSCIRWGEDLCTPVLYYRNTVAAEDCQEIYCEDECYCLDTYRLADEMLSLNDGSINRIRYGEIFNQRTETNPNFWEDVADFFRGAGCMIACEGFQSFNYDDVLNECNCLGEFYPLPHGR